VLSPGAIVDPEDLRIPGEQPGAPIVVLEDLGPVPHGQRFKARQGKSLLLLTVLTPEVTMQRELRDLLAHQVVLAGYFNHPNLLPTYGVVRLPLSDDGFDTLFLVRPDPGCPTLREWLHEVWQAGHSLDPLNAVAIAVQVCEALAVMHDKFAHGYVTVDNVYMYPTGGMPQALLSGTAEGPLLPFAPDFERFVAAGYLPMAGSELFESPHRPRVETDVLGAAGLVLEILTGQALQSGMPLERFGLPPRLERVLAVASKPDPEDRPQDILMFSRRLQAAVGLGADPVEPAAVLEPAQQGEHADPRYPAVRAKPWRPPPPPPPPWAQTGPTQGSGAWNVGAPTPGSGAWSMGAGSGAWTTPGGSVPAPVPVPRQSSARWESAPPSYPASTPPAYPPSPSTPPPSRAPTPAFGRDFPVSYDPSIEVAMPDFTPQQDPGPPSRPAVRTQLFVSPPPPGPLPPITSSPPPGPPPISNPHSVSIVMPAPDGSMMAPLSRGPANYVIVRGDKRHGPYDIGQLERLIPMGKIRSVDSIEVQSTGQIMLAVDLPGLRPMFEARAREEEKSVVRPLPAPPVRPVPVPEDTRNKLWMVIGVLAFCLVAAAVYLASQ
jgi:hypothetical protein